jgi:hypothetical protein
MDSGAKPAEPNASLLPSKAGVRLREHRLQVSWTQSDDNRAT